MIFQGLNCRCGKVTHYQGAAYYVSCRRDDGKHALLAGPYPEHSDALARLNRVNRLAQDSGDPMACWYAYGTLAVLAGKRPEGKLNGALIADDARLAASLSAALLPRSRSSRGPRPKGKRAALAASERRP